LTERWLSPSWRSHRGEEAPDPLTSNDRPRLV
jgi:hypothetical protein